MQKAIHTLRVYAGVHVADRHSPFSTQLRVMRGRKGMPIQRIVHVAPATASPVMASLHADLATPTWQGQRRMQGTKLDE
jgi:hypothetical protein